MYIRDRRTRLGHVGLKGVGQGIQTGIHGQVKIHGYRESRINQRHIGHKHLADNGDFDLPRFVIDNRKLGNIRGTA